MTPGSLAKDFFEEELARSRRRGEFRAIPSPHLSELYDFSSNDYLGLSTDGTLTKAVLCSLESTGGRCGSTGSRLISGNSSLAEEVERIASRVHQSESALLFQSGYNANLGLISALARENICILYDESVHASTRDGIRLGRAKSYPFRHGDLNHLEHRLKHQTLKTYVCVEAVYSMSGQRAPLTDLVQLVDRYKASLIVDEAHSAGLYGHNGAGLVSELGLADRVFARVVTYGKAYGCQGAVVLGSSVLREYLINYARCFVYSTSLGAFSLEAILRSYDLINKYGEVRRRYLEDSINHFQNEVHCRKISDLVKPSQSPIQILKTSSTGSVPLANALEKLGFHVAAIRSPTVKRTEECLRICLHSFNTKKSITRLCESLEHILDVSRRGVA